MARLSTLVILLLISVAAICTQAKPTKPVPLDFGEKLLKGHIGKTTAFTISVQGAKDLRYRTSRLKGITFEAADQILAHGLGPAGWTRETMKGWEGSITTFTSPDGRTYELSNVTFSFDSGLDLNSTFPASMLPRPAKKKPIHAKRSKGR